MSIRDLALGALADQQETARLAAAARKAAEHEAAGNATRALFARLGTAEVTVDGSTFILEDEGFHGTVDKDGATVRWWCQARVNGCVGGTYDSASFHNLPTLGYALQKIDQARAAGRFHQDPPKRTETP